MNFSLFLIALVVVCVLSSLAGDMLGTIVAGRKREQRRHTVSVPAPLTPTVIKLSTGYAVRRLGRHIILGIKDGGDQWQFLDNTGKEQWEAIDQTTPETYMFETEEAAKAALNDHLLRTGKL